MFRARRLCQSDTGLDLDAESGVCGAADAAGSCWPWARNWCERHRRLPEDRTFRRILPARALWTAELLRLGGHSTVHVAVSSRIGRSPAEGLGDANAAAIDDLRVAACNGSAAGFLGGAAEGSRFAERQRRHCQSAMASKTSFCAVWLCAAARRQPCGRRPASSAPRTGLVIFTCATPSSERNVASQGARRVVSRYL